MLKRYSFLALLFITAVCNGQVTPTSWWTWVNGDSATNNTGVYGSQGTASTFNKPGARRYSISWKDANDNLWLFGGQGYATGSGTGFLNDLWKYDPSANTWIWMNGENTTGAAPVYGTQGIASSTNKPGARYSSVSWTDAPGNLWLFGGYGFASDGLGYLNDLWKYNPSTNQWTFIKGDSLLNNVGNYGTQTITSSTNKPGSRYGGLSWTDASGNLWLFGGYGYAPGGSNDFNDLWKYNTATNDWTWMKGNNIVNTFGAYGSKGIAGTTNNPGARRYSTGWQDNSGNLWLFGGYGYASSGGVNFINDLWKYNAGTNEWTWINGDSTAGNTGVYGSQGTPSTANKPGARYLSTALKDAGGNILLFGGYGYASTDGGYLSDLWKYDVPSNEWTWLNGENNANNKGTYGSPGTPGSNLPGARQSMLSWTDNTGNLWLFGGDGYGVNGSAGYLNDLWKFGGAINILALETISIKAFIQGSNITVEWTVQNETGNKYEIEKSADGRSFKHVGSQKTNSSGKNTFSWIDNTPIKGNNFYRIKTVDEKGSVKYTQFVQVSFGIENRSITIYPNPVINSNITLQLSNQPKGKYHVQLFNNIGQQVYTNAVEHTGGSSIYSLQLNKILVSGIYQLQVSNAEEVMVRKSVISQQ